MKTIIIYFSRTGNSKRVADKLAQQIEADTVRLTDEESWVS